MSAISLILESFSLSIVIFITPIYSFYFEYILEVETPPSTV
jgi:hypothetical protein